MFNTLDGRTIAVDTSGKEVWRTQLADINLGESMTMAPLIVKDKVLVGLSGGEFGIRGWLSALDLNTGKLVWRAYHTGPDKDVLIGPRFKPFYASERGTDLGVQELAGPDMEERRRRRMGMVVVRPLTQSDLLRHLQSWTLERRYAGRRKQVDRGYLRTRRRHW